MIDAEATVDGDFEDDWRPVVEAFAATVDTTTGGAALAIIHHGRTVVDVYSGTADIRTGQTWQDSTRAILFSTSKGLAALTVNLLADQGRLDLDWPVAEVWPEFGANGKARITIGDVLAHRAGLPAPASPLDLEDLIDNEIFASRLADLRPLWPAAGSHLYHAITWGPLVSELVRRATGEEIAEIFAREIAGPLQADVTLQATPPQASAAAYATNSPELEYLSTTTIPQLGDVAVAGFTAGGALPLSLVGDGTGLNDPRVLASGLVSAGGIGTATGVARIWSATIADEPLLSDHALRALVRVRSTGPAFGDTTDGSMSHRWGAGVQLASAALPLLSARSFGHDGAGGQCGFADPAYGIGFGYVRNRLSPAPVVGPILGAVRALCA